MKNLLALTFLLIFVNGFTQTDKYTEKLKSLYLEEAYDKVIKFKASKTEKMASQSIFYKAMAQYMTNNDAGALSLFDMAIEKGPADYDMYYYRGMTKYYLKKYESALGDLDKAIAMARPITDFYSGKAYVLYELEQTDSALVYFKKAAAMEDCGPRVFASIANIYSELKNYADAVTYYKKAIAKVEVSTSTHQVYNYNLGLNHQLNEDFDAANTVFLDHINLYPTDYHAISKLIQVRYQSGGWADTEELKTRMRQGYETNELPDYLSRMYCFDQFMYGDRKVLAFESYTYYEDDVFDWKHKFLIQDEEGEVDYKLLTVVDSTVEAGGVYIFNLIKNDTLFVYDEYSYTDDSHYGIYKTMIKSMLSGEYEPVKIIPNYSKWHSNEVSKIVGDMGSTFETAVVVSSVAEEYQWLRKYYPGYDFIMQALVSDDTGKYYDILTFKTADGEKKSIYFDINSFFGKY